MHSDGFLLDGRVRHAQATTGHRTGIEPVLLAASVPARSGERVLEAGTGSGAALLCLAWRVPGVIGVGLELDPNMAALAARNAAANGFHSLSAEVRDVERFTTATPFDHAIANPPWHHPAGTRSTDAERELARRADPSLLDRWTAALSRCVRPRGTVTVVTAAGMLPALLGAFSESRCGSPAVLPLWPKTGTAAKLVLVRAVKIGRGPCRLLPGLVLHETDGRFTTAAEAVLRDGAALPI